MDAETPAVPSGDSPGPESPLRVNEFAVRHVSQCDDSVPAFACD